MSDRVRVVWRSVVGTTCRTNKKRKCSTCFAHSGRANGRATQHYCPVSGHAQASSFFGVAQQ